jgi:hypothetical protein
MIQAEKSKVAVKRQPGDADFSLAKECKPKFDLFGERLGISTAQI